MSKPLYGYTHIYTHVHIYIPMANTQPYTHVHTYIRVPTLIYMSSVIRIYASICIHIYLILYTSTTKFHSVKMCGQRERNILQSLMEIKFSSICKFLTRTMPFWMDDRVEDKSRSGQTANTQILVTLIRSERCLKVRTDHLFFFGRIVMLYKTHWFIDFNDISVGLGFFHSKELKICFQCIFLLFWCWCGMLSIGYRLYVCRIYPIR